MNSFLNYLASSAFEVDSEINNILNIWLKEVKSTNVKLLPLAKSFTQSCQGGKRLRGTLVKLGSRIVKGKDDPEVLKASAAFEIFQTAILAHDDIIDLSPIRRGKPTLYRELGGDHYGISQTIALADIGFFLASRTIAESNFPDSLKNAALTLFSQTIIETGLGEILDVEVPHLGAARREEDVITIHKLKTAKYTISGPLQLGAILGGAQTGLLNRLSRFGTNLGIAFQIQDDILGVFGDEESLGKSVTSDIEEGKNTLLITQALKKIKGRERSFLQKNYGTGKIGDKALEEIRRIFEDSGALAYSKKQAEGYVYKAKKVIAQITTEREIQELLQEMSDFLINRAK